MSRLVLALLPLLAACATQPAPPSRIAGDWRFVSIDGDAPAVPDRARLSFADDRINASVGCNAMAGPWRIEEGRLIAGPLAGTRMYCEGPVWSQEDALSALLVAAPTIAFEDEQLVLKSSGHSAALARVSPPRSGS
jgi:heat shock protein HslJ